MRAEDDPLALLRCRGNLPLRRKTHLHAILAGKPTGPAEELDVVFMNLGTVPGAGMHWGGAAAEEELIASCCSSVRRSLGVRRSEEEKRKEECEERQGGRERGVVGRRGARAPLFPLLIA